MRELTNKEVEEISGGVGLLGAGIGAAVGAGSAYFNGSSAGQIVGAGILGGISGFMGGIATSSFAPVFARGAFGSMAIETGIMSSAAAGSYSGPSDS